MLAVNHYNLSMVSCFSDPEDDEYKYTEQANMPGTKFDNKKRQTVRNLRIREDTAKVTSQ